jgi:hypothetical protein
MKTPERAGKADDPPASRGGPKFKVQDKHKNCEIDNFRGRESAGNRPRYTPSGSFSGIGGGDSRPL